MWYFHKKGISPFCSIESGSRMMGQSQQQYATKGTFSLHHINTILDWPHLTKKTAELLSWAINGRKKRNEIHEKLKQLLWRGDITAAIAFLDALPVTQRYGMEP